jgi:DNA-directed RNA polymerase subunit E'/Rpb7
MRMLLNDKIKIEPRYINKNLKEEITNRLKEKLEGKCTRHGYIRKGSIDVYKVTPGTIEMVSLSGYIQYDIYFYAEVCNPMMGSIIKCKVVNANKFGILAESSFDGESILEVVIAKNSVSILSDVDLENVKVGDEIYVEVLGKKFELNDKHISIVGKAINEKKKGGNLSAQNEFAQDGGNEDVDEDDVAKEEEVSIEDDDDEEEEDGDGDFSEGGSIIPKHEEIGGFYTDDEDPAFFEDEEDEFAGGYDESVNSEDEESEEI